MGAVRLQTVPDSPCRAVLRSLGRFTRVLNAIEACLTSDLTSPARFRYISTMKFQRVCARAPEKRFLINFSL